MNKVSYRIYPTLLDGYQDLLDSDIIYERYWGYSENPHLSLDEFREKQFQGLIDKINRVPFESEAASKGTAFNEVIDCMVQHRNSKNVSVKRVKDEYGKVLGLNATLNGRSAPTT